MKLTDKITFTNEDCMDLLARTPDKYYELAIVDPPYGGNDAIGMVNGNKHEAKRNNYKQFKNVRPSPEYFTELKRVSKHQVIWGGNFFGLEGGYICWNKNGTAFGDAELAYCSKINCIRVFEYTWNGMIQHDMKDKESRIHPTQKPVALYKWLLKNYAKPGDKILDTHGGSLSIAIACHYMGFELTACELDPEYFEKAVKRFKEQTLQLKAELI